MVKPRDYSLYEDKAAYASYKGSGCCECESDSFVNAANQKDKFGYASNKIAKETYKGHIKTKSSNATDKTRIMGKPDFVLLASGQDFAKCTGKTPTDCGA